MDWVTVEEKDANARVLDRGTPPCQYTAIHAPCGQPKQGIFHSRLPSRSRCLVERYPFRPRIKNDTPSVRASRTCPSPATLVAMFQGCRCDLHHTSRCFFCNKLVAHQSH